MVEPTVASLFSDAIKETFIEKSPRKCAGQNITTYGNEVAGFSVRGVKRNCLKRRERKVSKARDGPIHRYCPERLLARPDTASSDLLDHLVS